MSITGKFELHELTDAQLLEAAKRYKKVNAELVRRNEKLVDGLKPFAQFACSPEGECDCHNCTARDLINSITEGK